MQNRSHLVALLALGFLAGASLVPTPSACAADLPGASGAQSCRAPAGEPAAAARARLSQLLLASALQYARDNSHPVTGFVRDTVSNFGSAQTPTMARRASISSTGFMMTLVADLYLKGQVSRDEAYNSCRRPLRAVVSKRAADELAVGDGHPGAPGGVTAISYRGWYSHFIDWETGDRWASSEYAVTDSTWFLGGALFCAAVFPGTEVATLARDEIYGKVNFVDMMTDGGSAPDKRTLALSYSPEKGYSPHDWVIFQHSWLAYLLGMGSPQAAFRLPKESWSAWDRTGTVLAVADAELGGRTLYGDRRALFSHYFPAVFVPPQAIKEACNLDYFANSVTATLFNRWTAGQDGSSRTFQAGYWGIDAGPNPNTRVLTPSSSTELVVGTPETVVYGVNNPYKHNGTACLACAVAAAEFAPEVVFASLAQWCNDPQNGDRIFGRYGPANGVNLDYAWVAPYALSGIVGPMALSVANLDPATSVWSQLLTEPGVQLGLAQARRAPLPVHGCLLPEGAH